MPQGDPGAIYEAGIARGIAIAVGTLHGQPVDRHFGLVRLAIQDVMDGKRLTGPWHPPGDVQQEPDATDLSPALSPRHTKGSP